MQTFLFVTILLMCIHVKTDKLCRINSSEQNGTFQKWTEYVKEYKEYYDDLDECNEKRRKIFEERMKFINKWNKEKEQGLHNFTLGQTIFTARAKGELKNMFTFTPNTTMLFRKKNRSKRKLPATLDWRKKGVVTEVNYQFTCAACYAMSVVDSIAAQYALKTGKLVPLSAQMIIDCTLDKGNSGCEGGSVINSFKYIIKQKGIATDKEYPFTKKVDKCREHLARNEFAIKKHVFLPEGDEELVKRALVEVGPLSIALDADPKTFEDFRGNGIYDDPECKSYDLGHTGLLVGYGIEEGIDYWLVKNNWSKLWGDKGYIKIRRNSNNMCGVASLAAYPVI